MVIMDEPVDRELDPALGEAADQGWVARQHGRRDG